MMRGINWLPELVLLEDWSGSWKRYLEALYSYFKEDFVENKPVFRGQKVTFKRHPILKGKEATFWHLISERKEKEEKIDLRRCERIRWPRPIIENWDTNVIKFWKNTRKGEIRICLWLKDQEYLVILAERKKYILLWTAYMVTRPHRKAKLEKEHENYWKNAAEKR